MKIILILITLSMSQLSYSNGKRILMSDVDDTIKVSHVLEKDSSLLNVFTKNNSFLGMPQLYRSLDKSVDRVVYLSNAPYWIMSPFHKRFLKQAGFPAGELILRNDIRDKEHKLNAIRRIISEENPSELILIGDNGEQDAAKYRRITQEFPHLKMTTYIHLVYSQLAEEENRGQVLEENQIGFATAIDLAAELLKSQNISIQQYEKLLEDVAPIALREDNYIERGSPMMFPAWMDCRDLTLGNLPEVSEPLSELNTGIENRIRERCARESYED